MGPSIVIATWTKYVLRCEWASQNLLLLQVVVELMPMALHIVKNVSYFYLDVVDTLTTGSKISLCQFVAMYFLTVRISYTASYPIEDTASNHHYYSP